MEQSFVRETLIALLLFSLFVAWKVGKRGGTKLGCVGFGYVSLVVFLVGAFAVGVTAIITINSVQNISTYINGEKSIATVISYSTHYDTDDDGNEVAMYTPTYSIEDSEGEIYEVESSFSSSGEPIEGEQLSVYFNKENEYIIELTAGSLVMLCGMFIMWVVLVTSFVGIIMYAFDRDMTKYIRFVQTAGTNFLIPFVMIGFEALLIYGFLYGNDVPTWVSGLLLFFIVALGLGTVGFIMQLIKKGAPTWNQTGSGSWGASWNDDESTKEKQTSNHRKKKLGTPLNKKYRTKN